MITYPHLSEAVGPAGVETVNVFGHLETECFVVVIVAKDERSTVPTSQRLVKKV
jgi:hypothetical protein